jgi:hypothetical protein
MNNTTNNTTNNHNYNLTSTGNFTSVKMWGAKEVAFMSQLAERVVQAQSVIPTCKDPRNEGLPTALIDAPTLATFSVADDPLDAAIPINYLEGFPTIDGVPIWERLENESIDDYNLFKQYRDMPYNPLSGTRSIAKLAELTKVHPKALMALSKLRHWRVRCMAYDKFTEAERELRRRKEIEKLENKHAKAAEKLFDRALQFLEQNPEEINGKTVIELLELAVRLHRTSLGLPPDGPPKQGDCHGGTTAVFNILQQNTPSDQGTLTTGTGQKAGESRLFEILRILNQAGALPIDLQGIKETDGQSTVNDQQPTDEDDKVIDIVTIDKQQST